jgi:AraC-type DNA-binding domain-containing proteins
MVFPIIPEEASRLPFYITSIGTSVNQEPISRPEGYPSFHWLHVTSGEGKLDIGGKEFILGENTGFFFHPGIPHKYSAVTTPWETVWVTFEGYGISRLLDMLKIDTFEIFEITDMSRLTALYTEMVNAAVADYTAKGIETSYLVYKFILSIKGCTNIGRLGQHSINIRRLQPLLSFIEENYMKNISLEEMSNVLQITPQHLCRMFQQIMNMRPVQYLTKCRLRRAKEILAGSGSFSLSEIASQIGYNDASYFCAIFKEHEGLTPVQFKRMHKVI